ncbi:MAG: IS110 family transposase, partial [Bacteroidetes bacterium]|nr:IS110 family transposase [Bacteroidota bacterium]
GRGAAITATARKLAVIIWNMYTKQQEYKPMDETQYLEKVRQKTIKNIQLKIKRLGLSINELHSDLEFS